MKKKKYISILFVFVILLGCEKDKEEPKSKNFESTDDYIENPSISQAIDESEIPIYEGDNPPALAGDYNAIGEIVDASYSVSAIMGAEINSLITLYNQTNSGRISLREKTSGITVWGSGGYITGENGKFTIWQESSQSGAEAGLPDDITINVALLISGTKTSNGDLNARGISIITDVSTNNPDYNVENMLGVWWMWEAGFYLEGEASLKSTNVTGSSLSEILGLIYETITP